MTTGEPVTLYVYDLSNGLARQISQQLTGVQLDGIWHTSVVVYNTEFYFAGYGSGIFTAIPGRTHHGPPLQKIDMGTTEIDKDTFLEYLDTLRGVWGAEKYHLLERNCNNFSDALCEFLVGKHIPSHIIDLPRQFMSTPFGQMMRPQIDQMFRRGPPAGTQSMPAQSLPSRSTNHSAAVGGGDAPLSPSAVKSVRNLTELESLLTSSPASIIFFTSATCPPCRAVSPHFDRLATSHPELTFVKIDIGTAYEIGAKYGVRATPTFETFVSGEKVGEWKGGDPSVLEMNVGRLVEVLEARKPKHPHAKLELKTFARVSKKPVLYDRVPPLDKVKGRIEAAFAAKGLGGERKTLSDVVRFLEERAKSPAGAKLPAMPAWSTMIQTSLVKLAGEEVFPVIDLLRVAAVDVRVSGYFAEEKEMPTIRAILSKAGEEGRGFQLRLVTMQMLCNLFSSTLGPQRLLSSEGALDALLTVLPSALLDSEAKVRAAASALAFNVATYIFQQRTASQPSTLPESATLELVAALVEALQSESSMDAGTLRGLVLAIGHLAYLAPVEGDVLGLLEGMEVSGVLKGKGKDVGDEEVGRMCKEVAELCRGLEN
ncbi:hypothetical protein YB2330_000551 [Saitoella coloradoensis]